MNKFAEKTLALWLAVMLMVSTSPCVSYAADEEKDVIFKSLKDEVQRSVKRLKLPPHKPPYFVEYSFYETDDFSVECSLGSVMSESRSRNRSIFPVVRVGSYKMDNANFSSGAGSYFSDFAPVDDNYLAMRRVLWLLTDHLYKAAVETLEEKKAYLLGKETPTEELDDFLRQEPLKWVKPIKRVSIDQKKYTETVKHLSGIFKEYPKLFDSYVNFNERIINKWLVNSEGSMVRTSEAAARYLLYGCFKTKEGMVVSDWDAFINHERDDLPSQAVLEETIRKLVERIRTIAEAPLMDYYEGPVLFEDQAAADFFAQALVPRMTTVRPNINDTSLDTFNVNPLAKKMGKRVMPPFLSVIDDPLTRRYLGMDLMGCFDVDDEGVKAQKITVVENGVLKSLCAGRNPTAEVSVSNGHGSNSDGDTKTSSVFIQSSNQLKQKALRNLLKKLGRDAGLDHVFIVRKLMNPSRYDMHSPDGFSSVPLSTPGSIGLSNPLLIYKVSLKDGKETLVRGARFVSPSMRVLKDIVATGDDTRPYLCEKYDNYYNVITPSILVRELEMERIKFDQLKPPVIENPLLESHPERSSRRLSFTAP